MIKHFRAWDGEQYWYTDDTWKFINDYKITDLQTASFTIKDIDMFTGKIDASGRKIYENDLIVNPHQDQAKVFQIIWSADECGFRKIPFNIGFPETKIDEAFMEIIGTIHSQKE